MLNPKFPFTGDQVILTSDRVILHSKSDGIFLFGKSMIALSSTQTINLDATEKILLDSDKIELGHKAETLGDPVILGNKFINQFKILLNDIQYAASQLQTVSETNPAASFVNIKVGGDRLYRSCNTLIQILNNLEHPQNPLSKNTFTR